MIHVYFFFLFSLRLLRVTLHRNDEPQQGLMRVGIIHIGKGEV